MTLATMRAEVRDSGGAAIPGYSWPVAAFPFEERIARVHTDNIVSCLMGAGRNAVQASPIIDADAADLSRRWTAQSANITVETDAAVLGGYPRYRNVGSGVAGNNSLQATLAAPLASFTFATLFRPRQIGIQQALVSVGPFDVDGILLFAQTTNFLILQRTASEQKITTAQVALDTWVSIIASYDSADNSVQVFVNSTTANITSTFSADPGTSRAASLLASTSNAFEANAEMAASVIWNRALHTDAAAIADVMAGLTGLAAL